MWEVLTGDVALMRSVLKHLMEVLILTLPYQEKTSTSASGAISYKRIATPVPKSVRERQLLFLNTSSYSFLLAVCLGLSGYRHLVPGRGREGGHQGSLPQHVLCAVSEGWVSSIHRGRKEE